MNFLDKKNIIILAIILLIICISIYFFTKEEDYEYIEAQDLYVETTTFQSTEEETKIIIHISGEVITPGIVNLYEGARIYDAISAAGGATELSDFSKVNLAYGLKDGQKIYIPSIYEEVTTYIQDSAGNNILIPDENSSNLININTANQAELETLPGVRRIYSKKNNPV